jgi:hypothetical protein
LGYGGFLSLTPDDRGRVHCRSSQGGGTVVWDPAGSTVEPIAGQFAVRVPMERVTTEHPAGGGHLVQVYRESPHTECILVEYTPVAEFAVPEACVRARFSTDGRRLAGVCGFWFQRQPSIVALFDSTDVKELLVPTSPAAEDESRRRPTPGPPTPGPVRPLPPTP